jgi:hypothetical protein
VPGREAVAIPLTLWRTGADRGDMRRARNYIAGLFMLWRRSCWR